MRISVGFLTASLIIGNIAKTQPLKHFSFYTTNEQVSKAAKDFFNGKFKASDDEKTLSILDSIGTRNNITRPFYRYLASRMMDNSDGVLSEALGLECKEFLESQPDNAME